MAAAIALIARAGFRPVRAALDGCRPAQYPKPFQFLRLFTPGRTRTHPHLPFLLQHAFDQRLPFLCRASTAR